MIIYDKYDKRPEKFINMDVFREAAIHYLDTCDEAGENGRYTKAIKGTKEYYKFWDEEQRRCRVGLVREIEPGKSVYISGFHYFYLNYCVIRKIKEWVDEETGKEMVERETSFPDFYDGDWEYFMAVEEAENNGKHMVVLKARRKGFSFKAASMLARNYYHKRGSKGYAVAAEKEFLTGDGLLTKAWEIMSFIDKYTAWSQPRLKDTELHKRAGFKEVINGTEVEQGLKSEIMGITLKNDVQKIRGKAGELMFFEEAGKFPDITQAWDITWPTMTQGNKTLGLMVAFGTGGTEGANFEGLEGMFRDPEAYHIQKFENIWDEGGLGTYCGWFVPDYVNLDGFIDENGNSDVEGAKKFRENTRRIRKESNDPKALDQHIAEHPFTPAEAVLQIDANLFPVAALQDQYNKVIANKLMRVGTSGSLYRDSNGSVKFRGSPDFKPIYKFPHKKAKNNDGSAISLRGAVVVYEAPYRGEDGKVPNSMYIVCHDPYGQNQAGDSSSLGATYVIKRPNRLSQPDDLIVASYVGRPDTQDEYNNQLFLLAEYYGAKIGFENDRGDVIGFAKRFNRLHYLQEQFEMLHKKELQSKTVNRDYGMHMTEPRKDQGEIYIRDWLNTPRGVDEEGNVTLNLHKIYDPALLTELIKFNREGNFDRVMALMIGMYHTKELHGIAVSDRINDNSQNEWFDRHWGNSGIPIENRQSGFDGDIVHN